MKNLCISTNVIAKICNVSQGTVDRALNNRPSIRASTKQRILNVAKQYGYREDIKTDFEGVVGYIGVIVFNLNNEFFPELITELEYVFRQEGFCAVVMMSHYNSSYEIECIRNLYNSGVEGIVLCSVNNGPEFENYLKLFDIPIVAVGNKISGISYVGIDDFAAMREVTENVIKRKPQNIVYFSPAVKYPNATAQHLRYEGFLKAVGNSKYSVVTDIENIQDLYDEETVIIYSTDYYAVEVYRKNSNVKVVGFDNISILDKYNLPIDSVGYSVSEIAQGALNIIKSKKSDIIEVDYFINER